MLMFLEIRQFYLFLSNLFFISFYYLIALPRISNAKLNGSGKSRHPNLRMKVFNISPWSIVNYRHLLPGWERSPISSLLKVLIINVFWILSNAFSPSIEMIIGFPPPFFPLNMVKYLNDFWVVSQWRSWCVPFYYIAELDLLIF